MAYASEMNLSGPIISTKEGGWLDFKNWILQLAEQKNPSKNTGRLDEQYLGLDRK